jgi:hypothetical protein
LAALSVSASLAFFKGACANENGPARKSTKRADINLKECLFDKSNMDIFHRLKTNS